MFCCMFFSLPGRAAEVLWRVKNGVCLVVVLFHVLAEAGTGS